MRLRSKPAFLQQHWMKAPAVQKALGLLAAFSKDNKVVSKIMKVRSSLVCANVGIAMYRVVLNLGRWIDMTDPEIDCKPSPIRPLLAGIRGAAGRPQRGQVRGPQGPGEHLLLQGWGCPHHFTSSPKFEKQVFIEFYRDQKRKCCICAS